MRIRRFQTADARDVSALIIRTMRTSNAKDYPPDLLEEVISRQRTEDVLTRASWTHFYVAEEAGELIGCGAIGPYWDSASESSLFSFFVAPEQQGRGIGRAIMETLEADEFFLRASRIEIPASITALGFYQKMGYTFKKGCSRPDSERLYRLEKFRCKAQAAPGLRAAGDDR